MEEDNLDPFDIRITFVEMMKRLTSSQQSVQKVANFAFQHRRFHEDLFGCIIDELAQCSKSSRLNLLYVLDFLCQQSIKHRFNGYLELLKSNLMNIIQFVVPQEAEKSVVNGCEKVLSNWKKRQILPKELYCEAESFISQVRIVETQQDSPKVDFSKAEMLRRIEEDREQHKRLKESSWFTPWEETKTKEFEDMWEITSELNEEDFKAMKEEDAYVNSLEGMEVSSCR